MLQYSLIIWRNCQAAGQYQKSTWAHQHILSVWLSWSQRRILAVEISQGILHPYNPTNFTPKVNKSTKVCLMDSASSISSKHTCEALPKFLQILSNVPFLFLKHKNWQIGFPKLSNSIMRVIRFTLVLAVDVVCCWLLPPVFWQNMYPTNVWGPCCILADRTDENRSNTRLEWTRFTTHWMVIKSMDPGGEESACSVGSAIATVLHQVKIVESFSYIIMIITSVYTCLY